MKIAKIETAEVRIPLRTPFKTALRTVDSVHDVLVRVTADNGAVGYGEAPPTAVITGDTIGSIRCAVEEFIAPALVGREVEDLDGTMTALQRCIVKNTSAKAAVDMALFDLFAQSCQKPLYQVLGGAKKEIETDLTISVNPTLEMVQDARDAVARGFRVLKIKVGKDGLSDIQRLKAGRRPPDRAAGGRQPGLGGQTGGAHHHGAGGRRRGAGADRAAGARPRCGGPGLCDRPRFPPHSGR